MAAEPLTNGLTTATALVALKDACHQLNLTPTDARLLRIGENAIYALPANNLVARIARSENVRDRVEREVATARWLADLDFPAVRPAKDLPQAVPADGRLVTFWELATETDAQKTTSDLGRVLKQFHALPPPPFILPEFDPFSVVPARLAQPTEADPTDVAFLSNRHDELVETYQALQFDTPFGLIHGDAHRSNLIATPSGILLSDFEVVAHGPREWDLTPTALAVDRFGLPRQEYDQFVEAYGRDVTQWHGYRTMCAIRELTMTTWLMQNVAEDPKIAEEFHARVTSMREGDHARQWKAF
jgi:Ser/Thr protein kinase RdoA (MazF antagonist)